MKNLLYTIIMILMTCFGVMAQSPTENYIKTTTYTAPSTGVITENDTIVSVTYFDGLGRAKQSVAVRGGGNALDHNLIPWRENWAAGSGSAPFFSQAGQTLENERELGLDPFGNTSMLWKCGNDADGGWDTHFFAIDNTVSYRYTVWVKRTGSLDGNTYHGVRNVNNLADVPLSNPYFWAGDLPQIDQWYLLVGVVHPHDYAGGDTGVSGVYDAQGNKVLDGTEFKWDTQNSTSRFRNYMYYSTDTNARQYFYNPVLQKLDGTQASLDDIVFERGAPDVITPVVYDNFGRQTKEYLPYATLTQNGNIHNDPVAQAEAFYNVSEYENTTNPYAEKVVENSPLNRVLEQGAPGTDWLADPTSDTDHTIKLDYDVNVVNEVPLFEVTFAPDNTPTLQNSGFYNPGTLDKTITKDKNWQPGD